MSELTGSILGATDEDDQADDRPLNGDEKSCG